MNFGSLVHVRLAEIAHDIWEEEEVSIFKRFDAEQDLANAPRG